ncbi:MAG TPA: DUF4345 domain-containing protein [Flavisolibacter sp.]|jgi:hypothetical protein|nr:DUF4345 domain-containing protein [Flavisolibacter sp.]
MKANKFLQWSSTGYVIFSALSVLSVSVMALFSPQAVMDLVATKLPNNDAISSIRGVYGGVGLTFVLCMLYTLRRNRMESLALLGVFWGLYAISRILTIFADGSLGAFGNQWLAIEVVFCLTAVVLRWFNQKRAA